jgi:Holliday junction resolvase RusA-like endonuclease
MVYKLELLDLSSSFDLWGDKVVPNFKEQLKKVGHTSPDNKRYKVKMIITQGNKKPTKDIDHYVKSIFDIITQSEQMWFDDDQVDELYVKREFDKESQNSKVDIEIENINN